MFKLRYGGMVELGKQLLYSMYVTAFFMVVFLKKLDLNILFLQQLKTENLILEAEKL